MTEKTTAESGDYAPLKIHIPEPPFRPGDTPDFSDFKVPEAGAVKMPAVDTPVKELEFLSEETIRVLDEDLR